MDILRTVVTGFELGGFGRAADRLGRAPSAVSTQLRKLAEQIEMPLVQKSGRGLALTTAREALLSRAKRIPELNDEAVDTIRSSDIGGWVRLGARGLQAGPLLAVGDGAMGFWAALEEVFPTTRAQRCWFHKMGNVLNALPKAQQGRAKADLQSIWMAATRADAYAAFDRFLSIHAAKYPKATDTLKKDRESLLAFYDFPAEHWQHLRTTNAIESTFATVRHCTTRTRNCVSRPTFLGLAFKLIEEAEKTWRRINGPEQIKLLLKGIAFKDGEPVQDDRPDQQKLAA